MTNVGPAARRRCSPSSKTLRFRCSDRAPPGRTNSREGPGPRRRRSRTWRVRVGHVVQDVGPRESTPVFPADPRPGRHIAGAVEEHVEVAVVVGVEPFHVAVLENRRAPKRKRERCPHRRCDRCRRGAPCRRCPRARGRDRRRRRSRPQSAAPSRRFGRPALVTTSYCNLRAVRRPRHYHGGCVARDAMRRRTVCPRHDCTPIASVRGATLSAAFAGSSWRTTCRECPSCRPPAPRSSRGPRARLSLTAGGERGHVTTVVLRYQKRSLASAFEGIVNVRCRMPVA